MGKAFPEQEKRKKGTMGKAFPEQEKRKKRKRLNPMGGRKKK
jgi:hypothetical protein